MIKVGIAEATNLLPLTSSFSVSAIAVYAKFLDVDGKITIICLLPSSHAVDSQHLLQLCNESFSLPRIFLSLRKCFAMSHNDDVMDFRL